MERRDFLKRSFLGLGAILVASVANISNSVASVILKAVPGKLGYREKSSFPQKSCENCKNYKAESGECVLLAMRNVMKADVVLVEKAGYCNMWAKVS